MYNVGMGSDLGIVVAWWGTLFLVGTIAYPFTKCLFRDWLNYLADGNDFGFNLSLSSLLRQLGFLESE